MTVHMGIGEIKKIAGMFVSFSLVEGQKYFNYHLDQPFLPFEGNLNLPNLHWLVIRLI